MTDGSHAWRALFLLLRLDTRRIAASARRPAPGAAIALLLPPVLLLGVLWAARDSAAPQLQSAQDGAALGMLVAGPLAFLCYGVLFRAMDQPFLRRVGVPQEGLFLERAARLLVVAVAIALVPAIPAAMAGLPVSRLVATSLAAATAAWGVGAASVVGAARALAGHPAERGWGCLTAGMWDRELAAAAPLVYAPLAPLIAGAVGGAWVASHPGGEWVRMAAMAPLALVGVWVASRWWEQSQPRFGAMVQEMAFAPPPPSGAGEMRAPTGVGRLLPRPAAAVWARDAIVAGRRLTWATRLVWPVALVGFVTLARWGEDPDARRWICGAAVLVWLAQALAMVALGRAERAGPRWVDRTLGITPAQRLMGRWAWGWGMGLWLALPLGLAWHWWSGQGMAWLWAASPAGIAAVAAVASVASSGWR